ncbi:MAG TPA: YkgJ family cysteine cluster protein [Desulfomonilaceae bacterium]|nr:YkgJ family cysteine cluster protein [Desulfomonilaceae bacterium]
MKDRLADHRPALQPVARLTGQDVFRFECGPHVPCFTECCAKLELRITPYDVLRLKKKLGMSSGAFLDSYTSMKLDAAHGFPEFVLKMDSETGNRCPFVTPQGCSVYEDRPGACRMYPLGRASTSHPLDGGRREFYFTVKEDHCRGFEQKKEWKVSEWVDGQGLMEYNRVNDLLMELYVLKTRGKAVALGPQHMQMFVMACYNLDRFRDFIFQSKFLEKFELEDGIEDAIRRDDRELLVFGVRWLRFALFREPVLSIR